MALKVYWSKRADQKFDAVISYLSEEWGEMTTKAFVKRVYDFLDILAEFPEIGTLENADRNIRGFVIVKQLTVFYKIVDNRIVLLNFFDNRMNPGKRKF